MQNQQPNYKFYPTLLDAYQRMVDTTTEDFLYQSEDGKWHKNWNEEEGTLHYSDEEVAVLLRRDLIDRINRVPTEPSEAASKGTAFNMIIDSLVKHSKQVEEGQMLVTIKDEESWKEACEAYTKLYEGKEIDATLASRIGQPFILAVVDGFVFCFDIAFCREAAEYFKGCICQYFTKGMIETSKGLVELYGYIDYLNENRVYDAKTTKSYTFGNYQKYWQRFAYPYTLIESEMMNEVSSFEFTVFVLAGGGPRTPLIHGSQYKEVYTYDHEMAKRMLTQQCERFIEFLEANRHLITNRKIFGLE